MRFLFILFLLTANFSIGQLISGDLLDESRKIIGKPAFIVEGLVDGYIKYELAVDRTGKVTSARQIETNIRSTPARYHVKNYIKTFKFEPGTYYPKFHHVIVKITVMKGRE